MEIIEFNDIAPEKWDEYVSVMPESTYHHTSWFIDYQRAISGQARAKSFVILDCNAPMAICPLTVSSAADVGKEYAEASFASVYPAIVQLPSAQRRRMARRIFGMLDQVLRTNEIKRVELCRHPISLGFLRGFTEPSNMAEAISYGYLCHVTNTIIVDLRKGDAELTSDMSKYHRKHIRKTKKQGVIIKEVRGDTENLSDLFEEFRLAHFKSAGRLTRPMESWDAMESLLKLDKAALFIASIEEGVNISFLYCGEFDKLSFGWSQVNIDEYEVEFSPRHLLEWEAMMSYKKRGFHYYEVGAKYDMPLLNHVPGEKEITISQFKERYGGKLYNTLYFEKFFDRDLFHLVYMKRIDSLLSSDTIGRTQGDRQEDCD